MLLVETSSLYPLAPLAADQFALNPVCEWLLAVLAVGVVCAGQVQAVVDVVIFEELPLVLPQLLNALTR